MTALAFSTNLSFTPKLSSLRLPKAGPAAAASFRHFILQALRWTSNRSQLDPLKWFSGRHGDLIWSGFLCRALFFINSSQEWNYVRNLDREW